ncbi:YciI family protein [Jatrophihabitans endophyticus]|uniref:YciI family protein n=1 Tax=Jatrophihabitans endophyticus TaxID=1206085 RepID=UPI0019F87445|nr:YciI family protein [Jatrophihabitans endophyticus]MBE7188479.1 YciI family protein [Jatrophihabitans endophyticus]
MRVMVLVKANDDTEAGVLPTSDELAAMGAFNEQLVNAGVMLAGDGLKDSSNGKRVRFGGKGSDSGTTVLDGPFAETKELVAGYWIWQVASMDEAVEWLRRAPFRDGDEVELRPFFEAEDFGPALTPELREQEQTLRDRL